tara:strand:- start:306 stop:659 length:354 start_codon:yes stop_codon:yes gene_type:complete
MSCLDNWFNNNKYTCPLCRTLITEYKNNEITNKLIFIGNNNSTSQRVRDISNNINNNMLYQNLRLKVCLTFSFVALFFFGNFLFIFHHNNLYLINKYEDYINCTIHNCPNNIEEICK